MGKRLILALALALAVGLTFSAAYAEVQNVKVSGDMIFSGVARQHFNLQKGAAGDSKSDSQNFMMTQTRVRIDADLTDNVSATVRLINERVWNGNYDRYVYTGGASNESKAGIDIDLAYVTLKEFLYSPLTLTIGRQEIRFGNGLIIGNAGADSSQTTIPTDLSERKSFDAIRSTLNYDPLVIDTFYAKIGEDDTFRNNDQNLMGVNATYTLSKKANLSAYYFNYRDNYDQPNDTFSGSAEKPYVVNTIGALLSVTPIDDLVGSLEVAYQFGKEHAYNSYPDSDTTESRMSAWALQGMVDYTFSKVKMTPKIGASYTYLSGKSKNGNSEKCSGWEPMFYDQKLNNITYALLPFRNLSVINLKGSIKPVEDVTLSLNYGYYDRASRGTDEISTGYSPNGGTISYTGEQHLGDAIDATVTYDYTEDVQLGLTAGCFKAGQGIKTANDRMLSTQLIGSMKVTF